MENSTDKKAPIRQLMYVLIEDQKRLIKIGSECECEQTKRTIYDFVGTLQERWDELYQLTWE